MQLLTSKFSKLSFISLIGLTISACGGDGTGDSYNNSTAKTSIKFPMHTYELIGERNDSIGMELYKIFSESLILHDNDVSITTRTEIDFAQNYATAENPFTEYDFTLTKDKLYESNGYSLPLYLEKNGQGSVVISHDQHKGGLTKTITFKTLSLSKKKMNSSEVINSIFASENLNSEPTEFLKLRLAFFKSTQTFPEGAECYQFLSTQLSHSTIEFDKTNLVNKTYSAWVKEKKTQGLNVITEQWANKNVAYVKKDDGEVSDDSQMVVAELNGKLYFGDYTSDEKVDLSKYIDPSLKSGLCSAFDQKAAYGLHLAFRDLPTNPWQ